MMPSRAQHLCVPHESSTTQLPDTVVCFVCLPHDSLSPSCTHSSPLPAHFPGPQAESEMIFKPGSPFKYHSPSLAQSGDLYHKADFGLFVFLFWGHVELYSGLIPASVLRHCS